MCAFNFGETATGFSVKKDFFGLLKCWYDKPANKVFLLFLNIYQDTPALKSAKTIFVFANDSSGAMLALYPSPSYWLSNVNASALIPLLAMPGWKPKERKWAESLLIFFYVRKR